MTVRILWITLRLLFQIKEDLPSNYQWASPKLTGTSGILSACPTVVLVCSGNCQESVGSKVMSYGENTLSRGRGITSKMKEMQECTDKI